MYCDFMNTEGLLIPIYEKLNSNCSSHNVKNCTPPLGMRTVTLMMIQPRAYILALGRDKNKIGMLIGPKPKHMRPKLLASAKSCYLTAVMLFYDESEYQLPSHRDWANFSPRQFNCALDLLLGLDSFPLDILICKCSSFEESIWVLIVSKPIIEYVTFWSNVIHISLVVSLNTKGCVGVRAILEIKGVCNRNRVSHEINCGV